MFEKAINSLLAGNVICPYTDRVNFEYLSTQDNFDEASRFLARIGKQISSPKAGGSFFAVLRNPNEVTRPAVASLHRKILAEVRPVMAFMDLCMGALRSDAILRSGDQINATTLLSSISGDNKLRSDLQDLAAQIYSRVGSTDRERLQIILRRLADWGYIKIEDSERETYCVTGLIDVFHDTIEFFVENTPGAKEHVEAQSQSGDLF